MPFMACTHAIWSFDFSSSVIYSAAAHCLTSRSSTSFACRLIPVGLLYYALIFYSCKPAVGLAVALHDLIPHRRGPYPDAALAEKGAVDHNFLHSLRVARHIEQLMLIAFKMTVTS